MLKLQIGMPPLKALTPFRISSLVRQQYPHYSRHLCTGDSRQLSAAPPNMPRAAELTMPEEKWPPFPRSSHYVNVFRRARFQHPLALLSKPNKFIVFCDLRVITY
ncbi:hypothetical protein Bpfe_019556 [Biomphalaria pfeifferi]|uniref:Uncharacterized protein n=1 Tax=Biomphalaria pfeifferi TaxID=112525 RepID=A0AAD8F5G2_BIOPF|nr:hypothetical protein Bpfe_019556 [Biomphalaria pfeifferi]